MQTYEITYISKEEKGDEPVAKILSLANAEVINHQELGKKKLAYPIKKEQNGNYFCTIIKVNPDSIQGIEKKINLASSILRVLIIKKSAEAAISLPVKEVKTAEVAPIEEKKEEVIETDKEKEDEKGEEEKVKKSTKKTGTKAKKEEKNEEEEEKERLKKLEEKLDQILKD